MNIAQFEEAAHRDDGYASILPFAMKRIVILLQIAVAVFVLTACTTTHTSPKPWSHITEGVARAELVRQLGEPASRSQNVDTWFAEAWQLRVMYDEGDYATNLVQELIMR